MRWQSIGGLTASQTYHVIDRLYQIAKREASSLFAKYLQADTCDKPKIFADMIAHAVSDLTV